MTQDFFYDPTEPAFEALPVGYYLAAIQKSEVKVNNFGEKRLSVVFDILTGEREGAKLFENFNYASENPQYRAGARIKLNQLLKCIDMHGKKLGSEKEIEGKFVKVFVKHWVDKNGHAQAQVGEYSTPTPDEVELIHTAKRDAPVSPSNDAVVDQIPF